MAQKRILENELPDAGSPEEKRPRPPAFGAARAEALNATVQKFCSALEPLLRRVINEEIERALEKHVPAKIQSSARQINESASRNLQLQFRNRLSLPIFTGSRVEGEQCCPIQVVLVDASTGHIITSGSESSTKVEIVVLEGDFEGDEEEDWTDKDFDSHVVREREGKRPLLTGDLLINLKEGIGILGELTFTDNSSWIRSRKFRLGARITAGCGSGIRIREAKTEAFTVKDHRGELYKKHYPPALHDEVWRLDKIGKEGAFHKRLNHEKIFTVQDFLRLLFIDPQKLRNVLGTGMSNKMWEGTVEHAKTCMLGNKLYVYYADAQHNIGVIFNVICELLGFLADGRYILVDELSEAQKVIASKIVKHAYGHLDELVEYDGSHLIDNKSCNLTALSAVGELPDSQGGQTDHKAQVLGSRVNQHDQSTEPNDSVWMSYPTDNSNFATPSQIATGAGFIPQNVVPETVFTSTLALSQQAIMSPLSSVYETQNFSAYSQRHGCRNDYGSVGLRNEYTGLGIRNQYGELNYSQDDWDRNYHEIPEGYYYTKIGDQLASELENQTLDGAGLAQVQSLIHIFNSGTIGQSHSLFSNMEGGEAFSFSVFTPASDESCSMSRHRLHGKAYICWLKLKAALKWGISIRKVAAAKRARLEEIED